MGRAQGTQEPAVPTGLSAGWCCRLFAPGTGALVTPTVFTPMASIPTLSFTQLCCKRKGKQVLKLIWARGKGNASRGHRGKLWFSLPLPAGFVPSLPSVSASSHALPTVHSFQPLSHLPSSPFLPEMSRAGAPCSGPHGSLVGSMSRSVDDCMCIMGLCCMGLPLNKYLTAHLKSFLKQGYVYMNR